jgi:nucleoside-diphosphate-sugar epimerase
MRILDKGLLEQKCREISDSINMNLMVIRQAYCLVTKNTCQKAEKSGESDFAFLVGNGNTPPAYIHVDDVSDLILRMIEKPVKYDIYNCTPSEHVSANSFVRNWGIYVGIPVYTIKLYPCI